MGNPIEQLNFEVILKDEKFKKSVQEDLAAAKDLNAKLSDILNVKKTLNSDTTKSLVNMEKVTAAAAKTAQEKAKQALQEQKVRTEIERTAAAARSHTGAVRETNSALINTHSLMRTISQLTGVTFSVIGLRRFLSTLIDITGQFEVQRMALRNMLQDVDGADKIFEDLYRFSSDSTYRFSELAKYAKQLAAFNIDKSNLLETTKMLGDVASGVGVSMDRLILAYGHVKSSGFLRGIQLRSFSQNGVPILEELSKMFTEIEGKAVSLGDVFDKMTKREIPFEMVEQAFKNMTSEGGKFYQMQEVLAKTLSGQINILKGRWENLLAAIGQANSGVLKDAVSWMSNLVSSSENVGRLIAEIAVAFGSYKAAVLMATIVTKGLGTVLLNVGVALEKFYLKLMSNPFAIIGAAAAAASVAIYQYATSLSDAEKITKTASDGINKFTLELVAEQAELERLYAKLDLATEGTEEYDRAKNDIYNRFGPYIQQLHEEGVAVDNLANIYDNLTTKIRESLKAKFLESESSALKESLDAARDNIYESFKKTAEHIGWTIQQQEDLWNYIVTGNLRDKNLEKELKQSGGGTIGLPGTFLYKDYGLSAEALRNLMQESLDAYEASMKEIDDTFKSETNEIENASKNIDADAKGWRGAVQKAIKDMSSDTLRKTGLAPKEGEEYYEYIERIGKTSQELTKERDLALKAEKKEKEDLLSAIKTVDKALEGNILKDARYQKTPWNGSGSEKDSNKEAIKDIKSAISLLEKYKSAYDKLEPVFGAEVARAWVFNNMGKDVSNLDEEIQKLIEDLRKMGEEGAEAADSIEARLGFDAANRLIKAKQEADKAQKALEKYETTYRKWASEDFNLGGTGFEYDIRKIFSDYNTKLGGVDEKYIKAVKEAEEAHKGDANAIAEETLKLGELRDAEKEYIKAQSQERINDLAESYLKDQYLLRNINLENLGGKTVKQLKTLKQGLIEIGNEAKATIANFTYYEGVLTSWGMDIENLTDEDLESLKDKLPETEIEMIKLMNAIKRSGLTFDQLGEKIQSALKKGLKDLDDEEKKALAQLAKNAAKQVLSLADSFERLGEATGNAGLAQAAKDIGAIGNTIQSAAEGFKSGGWIGAVIGAFVSITDQIVNAAAIAAEKERELRDAIRDVKVEVMSASFDNVLSNGVDTVFGDNFVKNIRNATEGIAKAQEQLESLDKWMKQFREDVERHPLAHTGGLLYTLFGGEDVGNTLIQTKHSRWKATDEYATIEHLAEELGYDSINDKYGNLNPDLLEDILDLYGDLNEELKDWLVNSAEYSREYAKAMEQIEDATKSVFDKLASDMADKFIDNFLQMGNAVDDLSDTFADLGDAILRSFLQSYILDEILGKYKKMAQDALTKYSTGEMTPEDYAAWLDGFAQNVQEESETLAPAINGMIEAFKDRGLMNIDENTANSLGSGIKSITEDTANLLASYINAIRDDVSNLRRMQEAGWNSLNMLGSSVPTLNEYLAQIAATNYDIAQSNQSILSELRSVIGPVGTSGMVVRVEGL